MKNWFLCVSLLFFSGCAAVERWSDQLYPTAPADVVMETPYGDVGIALLPLQPTLAAAWLNLVRQGYYAPLDVDRVVPQNFMVLDPRWQGRYEARLPVAVKRVEEDKEDDSIRQAKDFEVGILANPDGTHNGRFVMMLRPAWASYPAPSNTAIARVVSGRDALRQVVRGDRVVLKVVRY